VLLDTATKCDLFADFGAHRIGQANLGQISFDSQDTATRRQQSDIHHQYFVLGQLLNL
jgi:hypothetical protein